MEVDAQFNPIDNVEDGPNLGYVPADGGPNQIGNMEDGLVLPDNVQAQAEGSAFSEAEPHMQ